MKLENLGKGISLEMELIPAGKFKMGSPASEKDRSGNDTQHEVTLTKPFYLGIYTVTQEQWEAVMGTGFLWFGGNPSSNKGAKLPVTDVSWEDCQEFIKKLNAKTDGGYRLPSEAEWEYACRAGTTTAYSFGDKITPKDANYADSKMRQPVAVGSYKANGFGLYDMHGNVCEWCEDWYDGGYPEGAVIDPRGPETGVCRVFRGGSFLFDASIASSSVRFFNLHSTYFRRTVVGFRLARTADIKASASLTAPKSDPPVITPATKGLLVAPFTEARAKEVQKEVAKSLKKELEEEVDLGKGIKLDLELIPAGTFMMGTPESERDELDLERDELGINETQHEVTLTKPFYLGIYTVTQEQWESVMGTGFLWFGGNPSSNKGAKLPVTNVSWEDCQEFIKKLNAKTKGGYRLPTEAEWEYACRAGTTTAYSFGDSLTKADANFAGDSIKAVGRYKPNAFGLYDMHGNVYEWCEGWYDEYPAGAVTDPKGPATGYGRVLRGGSFDVFESVARSSVRFVNTPSARNYVIGFRLARTP